MATIKSSNVIDEMFPDGSSAMMELDEPMTTVGGLSIEIANTDKILHQDFYNNFEDIFDDDDFS